MGEFPRVTTQIVKDIRENVANRGFWRVAGHHYSILTSF